MKFYMQLFLILCVLFNSGAHILMKYNTRVDGTLSRNLNPLGQPSVSILFALGACCFAISIFFYQAVLRNTDLSIAFSLLTGLNFVILFLYSFLVFREKLTLIQGTGMGLIFIGCLLLLYNYNPEKHGSGTSSEQSVEQPE